MLRFVIRLVMKERIVMTSVPIEHRVVAPFPFASVRLVYLLDVLVLLLGPVHICPRVFAKLDVRCI
jgi:hypothetical protein